MIQLSLIDARDAALPNAPNIPRMFPPLHPCCLRCCFDMGKEVATLLVKELIYPTFTFEHIANKDIQYRFVLSAKVMTEEEFKSSYRVGTALDPAFVIPPTSSNLTIKESLEIGVRMIAMFTWFCVYMYWPKCSILEKGVAVLISCATTACSWNFWRICGGICGGICKSPHPPQTCK